MVCNFLFGAFRGKCLLYEYGRPTRLDAKSQVAAGSATQIPKSRMPNMIAYLEIVSFGFTSIHF